MKSASVEITTNCPTLFNEHPPTTRQILVDPKTRTSIKIDGGYKINSGLARYFAAVVVRFRTTTNGSVGELRTCVGTLVSKDIILTSAIFFYSSDRSKLGRKDSTQVYLGATWLYPPNGERRPVSAFYIHPKFNIETEMYKYNIGWIRLKGSPSNAVISMKVDSSSTVPEAGEAGQTVGYARAYQGFSDVTEVSSRSSRPGQGLRQADRSVTAFEKCQDVYPTMNKTLHFCAGYFDEVCGPW